MDASELIKELRGLAIAYPEAFGKAEIWTLEGKQITHVGINTRLVPPRITLEIR